MEFTQSEYLITFRTSENKNKSTKKNKLKESVGCFCRIVQEHSSSFLQAQLFNFNPVNLEIALKEINTINIRVIADKDIYIRILERGVSARLSPIAPICDSPPNIAKIIVENIPIMLRKSIVILSYLDLYFI